MSVVHFFFYHCYAKSSIFHSTSSFVCFPLHTSSCSFSLAGLTLHVRLMAMVNYKEAIEFIVLFVSLPGATSKSESTWGSLCFQTSKGEATY